MVHDNADEKTATNNWPVDNYIFEHYNIKNEEKLCISKNNLHKADVVPL